MKKEIKRMDKDTIRNIRFLLCDITNSISNFSSHDNVLVSSPIQCLDKAMECKPEIIVIYFGMMPIKEREALVSLCTVLKRNILTKDYPVLSLLQSKHRKVIENLAKAKVDYIRYIGDSKLDAILIQEIIKVLGPGDRLKQIMKTICPFLNYSKIDAQNEMKVCGAYLDRLVLGGRRLHELCETQDHLHCEYYLNPRRRS